MRTSMHLRVPVVLLLAAFLLALCAQAPSVKAEGGSEFTAEQQAVIDLFAEINKHRKVGDLFEFTIFDADGKESGKIVREVIEIKDGVATLNETTSFGAHSQTQTTLEPDPAKMFKEGMVMTVENNAVTVNEKEYKDGRLVTLTMTQNMGGKAFDVVTKMWFSPTAPSGMLKLSQTMNGQPQLSATLKPDSAGLSENVKKFYDIWKAANANRKPGTQYEYEVTVEFGNATETQRIESRTERAAVASVDTAGAKLSVQDWDKDADIARGEAREELQPGPLSAPADAEYTFSKVDYKSGDLTEYKNCDQVIIVWEVINPNTGETVGYQSLTYILSAENGAGMIYKAKVSGTTDTNHHTTTTYLTKIISN